MKFQQLWRRVCCCLGLYLPQDNSAHLRLLSSIEQLRQQIERPKTQRDE